MDSNAKFNLFLQVQGRLETGRHRLRSLILPLTFADEVTVEFGGAEIEFSSTFDSLLAEHLRARSAAGGTKIEALQSELSGPSNLAFRAVSAFRERFPEAQVGGVSISIVKKTPLQAGLGGGSGNCAAVIRALATRASIPLDAPELIALCASLGGDVPCQFLNRPLFAYGVGDKLALADDSALAALRMALGKWHLLLVKPDWEQSTAEAYRNLAAPAVFGDDRPDIEAWVSGQLSALGLSLEPKSAVNPAASELTLRGVTGSSLQPEIYRHVASPERFLFNDFERVATGKEICVDALKSVGAEFVQLAGSGSAWVGGFSSSAAAEGAEKQLRDRFAPKWWVGQSSFLLQ